jgi:hypothetical protein
MTPETDLLCSLRQDSIMISVDKRTREDRCRSGLQSATRPKVHHRVVQVEGKVTKYLEAGHRNAPVLLIVAGPGQPGSLSGLAAGLADRYRVLCPEIAVAELRNPDEIRDDNQNRLIDALLCQLGVGRFALYLIDAGIIAGWKVAAADPSRVTSLIVQTDRDAFGSYISPWANGSNHGANGGSNFVNELRKALVGWRSQTKPPMLFLWSSKERRVHLNRAQPFERPPPAVELHIACEEPASYPDGGSEVRPRISEFLARHDVREKPEFLSL